MIKLFVDDYRDVPDASWHLAKTITEAIRILAGPLPVSIVALDHDIISHTGKHEYSKETFATVARYIALLPKDRLPKIVYFHTGNSWGAKEMRCILDGIVPIIDIENYDQLGYTDNYKEQLINLEREREKEELFQAFEQSEKIAKELEKEFPEIVAPEHLDPMDVYKDMPPLTAEEVQKLTDIRDE